MAPPDRHITNATWVAPDGRKRTGTIVVSGSRMRPAEGRTLKVPGAGVLLDARGLLIVPGIIDTHVHFREPGQRHKEGVANGSRAALKGGVVTVLDMPNNRPPCTTPVRLSAKKETFRRHCRTNWGLLLQARSQGALPSMDGAVAVKVYMARSSSSQPIHHQPRLTAVLARYPVVVVHAEDEELLVGPDAGPLPHHQRRPRAAIVSALAKLERSLIELPPGGRPRLVLAHASTREEVAWLSRMKHDGHDVWGETCPHYWRLTAADQLAQGAELKVNPPLRRPEDRDAVLRGLSDGVIDFVGSDHAPHSAEEKRASSDPPSGIPGIEWLGSLAMELLAQGTVGLERLLDLSSRNAARCYALPGADGIQDGSPADLTFVRMEPLPGSRSSHPPVTRAGYNPYGAAPPCPVVEATVVGGALAYHRGTWAEEVSGVDVGHQNPAPGRVDEG